MSDDDIVKLLRAYQAGVWTYSVRRAADRIERLSADLAAERERVEQYVDDLGDLRFEVIEMTEQRDKLREALKPLVECVTHIRDSAEYDPNHRRHLVTQSLWSSLCTQVKTARAVLKETGDGDG